MRLVSLVPSLTKTLCDLGLSDRLVGITSFCIDPAHLHRSATVVGGTKDPKIATIAGLNPSLVLGNEEENRKQDLDRCQEFTETWTCLPKGPEDVGPLLSDLGARLQVEKAAAQERTLLDEATVACKKGAISPPRFLYLIWQNPYMAVGRDTYISRLLELTGRQNAYTGSERYPTLSLSEMADMSSHAAGGIDEVLFSSEPYPFRNRDLELFRSAWPHGDSPHLRKIDGKLCSWWGTLTRHAIRYLSSDPFVSR